MGDVGGVEWERDVCMEACIDARSRIDTKVAKLCLSVSTPANHSVSLLQCESLAFPFEKIR